MIFRFIIPTRSKALILYSDFVFVLSVIYALATLGIIPFKWSIDRFFISSISLAILWMINITVIMIGDKKID